MHRWLLSFLMLMPLPAVADDLLIGLGYLNGLAGVNLEWATEHNSFYAMPAMYLDSGGFDTDEPRWVAGWRRKMERGLMSESGFFTVGRRTYAYMAAYVRWATALSGTLYFSKDTRAILDQ